MAKNAKAVKPAVKTEVLEVVLPHGFVGMNTTAMVLDVSGLKDVIGPTMSSLRQAIGTTKAEKLASYCIECLPSGKTAIVAVVAKKDNKKEGITQFLCLCPCGGSQEAFQINGTFLKPFVPGEKPETTTILPLRSRQKKVAYATR